MKQKDDEKVVAINKAKDNAEGKPVKRKRNRPDLAKFGYENAEPGDNTKYIDFALGSFNMPKVNLDDETEVTERINWYFNRCREYDMKPGVVGLSNALGISRQALWARKEGQKGVNASPGAVDAIKKAYNFLEELWEDFMMNGKVSPPNGIFIGKNHFSYRDVVDVAVTPKNDAENDLDAESITKRYIEDGRKVETTFTDSAES